MRQKHALKDESSFQAGLADAHPEGGAEVMCMICLVELTMYAWRQDKPSFVGDLIC